MKLSEVTAKRGELIRVLVANFSGFLDEGITQLIEQQLDMILVGEAQDNLELLLQAGNGADVVIMGFAEVYPLPGICSHLLSEYPQLKVLVVAQLGESGMLYWLGLRHQPLADVSITNLLSNIRNAQDLNPTD